jgi:hypothetical protein
MKILKAKLSPLYFGNLCSSQNVYIFLIGLFSIPEILNKIEMVFDMAKKQVFDMAKKQVFDIPLTIGKRKEIDQVKTTLVTTGQIIS